MYMKDWIDQLNIFLTMTGNEILEHSGTISHEIALEKAHSEYNKYKDRLKNELSKVEKDYIKQIETTAKKLPKKK